jgi:hypothetical protein
MLQKALKRGLVPIDLKQNPALRKLLQDKAITLP